MKKTTILMFFCTLFIALTLGACKKDYSKLVPQKVKELQEKGKLILSFSETPTDSDHYVVYADTSAIYIEKFADSVQIIKYGEKNEISCNPSFSENHYQLSFKNAWGNTETFAYEDIVKHTTKVYKDKYVLISINLDGIYSGTCLYFIKPDSIYHFFYESIDVNEKTGELNIKHVGDADYNIASERGYFSGEEYAIEVTLDCNGNIVHIGDNLFIGNEAIPTKLLGTPQCDNIIVQIAKKLRPRYYYNCNICGGIVEAENTPKDHACDWGADFLSNRIFGIAGWRNIGRVGRENTYQCLQCGTQVQMDESPGVGVCPRGESHVWNILH